MNNVLILNVDDDKCMINNSEYVLISTEKYFKILSYVSSCYNVKSDNGSIFIKRGSKVLEDASYTSYCINVNCDIKINSSNVVLKIVSSEGNIIYLEKKVFHDNNSFIVD